MEGCRYAYQVADLNLAFTTTWGAGGNSFASTLCLLYSLLDTSDGSSGCSGTTWVTDTTSTTTSGTLGSRAARRLEDIIERLIKLSGHPDGCWYVFEVKSWLRKGPLGSVESRGAIDNTRSRFDERWMGRRQATLKLMECIALLSEAVSFATRIGKSGNKEEAAGEVGCARKSGGRMKFERLRKGSVQRWMKKGVVVCLVLEWGELKGEGEECQRLALLRRDESR
jgi:hypothetical protein